MEENKINRLKSNLQIFRNWSIVITVLAVISLIYILYERYEDGEYMILNENGKNVGKYYNYDLYRKKLYYYIPVLSLLQ